MANFDNTKQKMVGLSGVRMEIGSGVSIVSGQTNAQNFTVATKLRKVVSGFGVMDTDGMVAVATTGIVSSGQVVFRRKAPIVTDADTITYELKGY